MSGNYLVRVRAQVMTRDDSTGGWVPMGGGGLSNVSVRKRALVSEDDAKHEYLIYGKRISDQTVVLSCTIKKDIEYNKVMPTFHHWRTGDKKFGLTFQTAADARAFDKGVKTAMEDLLDGIYGSSFVHATDIGEDEVFMSVNLPVERGDSRSSSGSSSNGNNSCGVGCPSSQTSSNIYSEAPPLSSTFTHPHANHDHLHRMHYFPRPQRTSPSTPNGNSGSNHSGSERKVITPEEIRTKHEGLKKDPAGDSDKIEIVPGEQYSYVQFSPEQRQSRHEYSYPVLGQDTRDPKMKLHKQQQQQQLQLQQIEVKPTLLPTKTKKQSRKKKPKGLLVEHARCRHCHEMFSEEENERGRCEYAPDNVRECVDTVTCIKCAQCMLYHCMSDAEGEYASNPCSCDTSDENYGKRWTGLVLLSFFVPCLWCHLPLRACHKCGVGCGICGGRHETSKLEVA